MKVGFHSGSGRYTLTERTQDETMYRDCEGELFGNREAGSFYRAVAQRMANKNAEGHTVVYQDCS